MSNELIAKLNAALDEDERAIRAYLEHRQHPDECDSVAGFDSCLIHMATAKMCRYRDMDFGRQQIAAVRKVLELHQLTVSKQERTPYDPTTGEPTPTAYDLECSICGWASENPESACPTLLALAEAYGIEP